MGRKKKESSIQVNKSLSLWDWLKEITVTKSPWSTFTEEDKVAFNPFMIHKFLSMNKDYIELVNYISGLGITDKEQLYKIYCEFIPKKTVWLKWIKANSKEVSIEMLKQIALYYECSSQEAEEYLELLDNEDVNIILTKTGLSEKEIKKLWKNL